MTTYQSCQLKIVKVSLHLNKIIATFKTQIFKKLLIGQYAKKHVYVYVSNDDYYYETHMCGNTEYPHNKIDQSKFCLHSSDFVILSIIFTVSSNSEFYEYAWLKTMIWYFD